MCLLVFALNAHEEYPFVFAGNRDERHDRPTRDAHWWEDAPQVLGGRDLAAGGAWLGVTRSGRFAVVTNYRDPAVYQPNARSRGELVHRFLREDIAPEHYLEHLRREAAEYNGFNLLFGRLDALWYFSNRGGFAGAVEPGVHGLSNHLLDTPWPKVERSRKRLNRALQGEPEPAGLLELLDDTQAAASEDLPDTGIGRDWERQLSPPRIVAPGYGTRASTVIRLHRSGRVDFIERPFDAEGRPLNNKCFEFTLTDSIPE